MAQYQNDVEKEVLSILTSCVASSQGNLTVEQLNHDYRELAGELVPLKKLNHSSLIDFLKSFPNEFRISHSYGKAIVTSLSADTKHIEKLVQTQKVNPKSRKRPPAKNFQKMRIPRFSNYNRSKFHNASCSIGYRGQYSSAPNSRFNSYAPMPLMKLPTVGNHFEPKPLLSQQIGNNFFSKTISGKVSPSFSSKRTSSQPSEPAFNPLLERHDLPNSRIFESTSEDDTLFYNPLLEKKGSRPKSPVHCRKSFENSDCPLKLSINTQKTKAGNKRSFREKLKELALRHGLEITYTPIPFGQKKTGFICKLQVGDDSFSSYPKATPTAEEGKEHVSEIAYNKLKETLKDLSPPLLLPETADIEVVFSRIKEMLCNENEGLWWDSLRKKYEKQYYESLNEDRIINIKQNFCDQISVLKIAGLHPNWILSLKKNFVPLTTNEFASQEVQPVDNGTISELPSLPLPEDGMWTIFVTYIKNCNEIWFRIIGEDYSDAFENLVTDMELFYMDESKRYSVLTPNTESYYACNYDESWFRVKFLKMEGEGAEILFVDAGDTEIVNLSNLYLLDPQFLKLPCQSILCVLAGLERYDFEDHTVLSALQNFALGKPLVAEVLSKDEDLSVILYDTSTDEDVNINEQLIDLMPKCYPIPELPSVRTKKCLGLGLYLIIDILATTKNENLNMKDKSAMKFLMNDTILEHFETPASLREVGGICEVYISHVSAEGDIFVRLESATFKTLEALLTTAKHHTAEILGNDNIEIDLSKLYLAKFSSNGDWHRAAPRTANKNKNGEVILKAIDKGFCERVACANIIHLKDLSEVLCKIPAQAIPCKLHNVPSSSDFKWTRHATDRLLNMTKDEPQLLKVILEATETDVAQVGLFQRIQPQNYLVSINETLDLEKSLFRDEDTNNNRRSDLSPDSNCLDNSLTSKSYISGEIFDIQELESPNVPSLNSFYDVYVTYAATPSNFAVQSFKTKSKLDMLMGEMFSYYSLETNRKPVKQIYEGGYYALLHTDGSWYRVCVVQNYSDQVSGHFVDYGDFFCASPDAFQTLWPNFRILPRQSLKATLGGIVPIGKDWTPIDGIRFGKLVHEKELVSQIIGIEYPEDYSHRPNNKKELPTLVLKLVDTSVENVDVYIDQVLIEEKRAIRV